MDEFRFKPFTEMTEADYQAVGFRSGLEIHQQLLTGKKLFCRCPAGRYSRDFNAEILRHMRPTLSELGEYDGTALMEFKTRKEIIYLIHRDTVCTYEMDDTPPFELNEEALDISLGIGMLYNLCLVDELHIARKQYLDGSIPTGFQRTTIVGVDGWIPYKGRKVRIVQLGLEEDACREVSDIGHRRVFLTDRLGMPLIETVTAPDMRTPQEVADVAQVCRRLVRSTGRVRTGIGAARQDVNVSVTGGTRVEIKGVPRIPRIPLLTYNEAMRQWNLLRLREELARRGVTPETFRAESEDVTRLLSKTRYTPVREALGSGLVARAVVLRGFRGLLNWQTQTDTFFSKEISDRVRVIACLTTLPNIIHSDSAADTISSFEWDSVRKAVKATGDDTVVVVWGDGADAATGTQEVIIRAREATLGVPSETRQALPDGTNGFERILPGPDRMYPDTDLPPKRITRERLDRVKRWLPVPVWSREERFRELGLGGELASRAAASAFAGLVERCSAAAKVSAGLAASLLLRAEKIMKRQGLDPGRLDEASAEAVFSRFRQAGAGRDWLVQALVEAARDGRVMDAPEAPKAGLEEVEKTIRESAEGLSALKRPDPARKERALVSLVMRRLRGRADGATVSGLVRLFLGGEAR